MIITKDMIKRAIELVTPSVERILIQEDITWGPKYVRGFVDVPGIEVFPFTLGMISGWKLDWRERKDFISIAGKKLEAAKRLGESTSKIAAKHPWLLKKGEYLYPGGVSRSGITVAVSGAKGRTDECIAAMIVDVIMMLAHLEADKRKEDKKMQI